MSKLRMPSPAMLVALIALFVALGGGAYAAFKAPKNSVGTKALKKNAVTSKKIRNGTIAGVDLRQGALGSGQIDESKLGKVPSAANADSASTLAGQPPTAFAQSGVFERIPLNTVPIGTADGEQPIYNTGPFTVTVACYKAGGNARVRARIATTVPGTSAFGLIDLGPDPAGIDMQPNTDANQRVFLFRDTGGENQYWFTTGAVTVFAPDGRGAQISLYSDYNFPITNGGTSGNCRFAGSAVVY